MPTAMMKPIRVSEGLLDPRTSLTTRRSEFFDVKFYPYDPVGSDPIFAAVSKKHVRDVKVPSWGSMLTITRSSFAVFSRRPTMPRIHAR